MTEHNAKPTNPKEAFGDEKFAGSNIPMCALTGPALVMTAGAGKYRSHNYLVSGVRGSTYYNALVWRHLNKWWQGRDIDPDDGLHELDHAIACLLVMRAAMLNNKFTDDRPPKTIDQDWCTKANAEHKRIVRETIERTGQFKPPHTETGVFDPVEKPEHMDPADWAAEQSQAEYLAECAAERAPSSTAQPKPAEPEPLILNALYRVLLVTGTAVEAYYRGRGNCGRPQFYESGPRRGIIWRESVVSWERVK